MDCAARKKAILEAKTFSDAEKTLQEAKISRSGMELARTAYQIREAQPNVANHFLATIIKEIEEHDAEHKEHEHEKKEQEYVGGEGHGVGGSTQDGLSDVTKHTGSGEKPDTGFEGAQNQMREDLMSGLHPDIAHMMSSNLQSAPPLTLPNQIKQMQYTVKKMVAPLVQEVERLKGENKQLREAYSALDKKLTETVNSKGSSLKIEMPATGAKGVRETVEVPAVEMFAIKESLEDKRARIAAQDSALSLYH